jgi:hypothetical protein
MITFGMGSQRSPAIGLEYLLGLDGNIEVQNDARYWVKMEVSSMDVTSGRPNGIRYSLTLHAPDNTRLIGFDNAHSVKPVGSRFKHAAKKFPYDHRHRYALDEGVLYEFDTAYQLVSDFYAEVDRVLKEISP